MGGRHISTGDCSLSRRRRVVENCGAGKRIFFKAPDNASDGTVLSDFESGKQVTIRLSLKEGDVQWANKKYGFMELPLPMKRTGSYFIPDCSHLPLWFGRKNMVGMIVIN